MEWFKYLFFGVILVGISMWVQINLFFGSLGREKSPITIVENLQIQQLIKDKTGVDVGSIKISESDRPFGMMIGIPGKPQLFLSRGLYDRFTPDEMEYVLLHETGHYVLRHTVSELFLGLGLLVAGVMMLRKVKKPIPALLVAGFLGLLFGIAMIRLGAFHELRADNYSVTRMTNPEGMINATNKFRGYYGKSLTQTENKVIQWMFYRGNPYDNRIKMAEEYMCSVTNITLQECDIGN